MWIIIELRNEVEIRRQVKHVLIKYLSINWIVFDVHSGSNRIEHLLGTVCTE